MKTYAENRYKNATLSKAVETVINDMNKNFRYWKSPTKSNLNRNIRGMQVSILRNFYCSDNPVSLFVDQAEIETLTDKEKRILVAEFGYFRERVERNLKIKNSKKEKAPILW